MFFEWDIMFLYTVNLLLAWAILWYGNKLLTYPMVWGRTKAVISLPPSGMAAAFRTVRPIRRLTFRKKQIKREGDGDEPPHGYLFG